MKKLILSLVVIIGFAVIAMADPMVTEGLNPGRFEADVNCPGNNCVNDRADDLGGRPFMASTLPDKTNASSSSGPNESQSGDR